MKETIIIIAILIIIIGGNFFTCKYLKNTSDDLVEDLKTLKKEINENKEEDVTEEIQKQAKNIYKKWEKTENTWAVIVLHSELDLIETSIIKMKVAIEENELDRCLEELETSIFLVKHISKKEKFCLKNVF